MKMKTETKEESVSAQASRLAEGTAKKKKYTCERWRKALKKHGKKKPQRHPQMPSIVIQVNHAKKY